MVSPAVDEGGGGSPEEGTGALVPAAAPTAPSGVSTGGGGGGTTTTTTGTSSNPGSLTTSGSGGAGSGSSINGVPNATALETVLATAGYDHTIKLWHIHTALCVKTFQHPDSQVNDLCITPDRRLVAAAGFQHVRLYDIHGTTQSPTLNFEGIQKNVTALGFNRDAQWMYTGGEDFNARIWDLRVGNPTCQKLFQTHSSPITSIALHPNNVELIVGDQSGTIHVWDLRNDRTEQLIPDQTTSVPVQDVAIDPLGKFLAAVNNKGDCYIWSLDDSDGDHLKLSPFHRMKAHKRYALKCCFSPDSAFLATTSADQTCKIWRTSDFSLVSDLHCSGQRLFDSGPERYSKAREIVSKFTTCQYGLAIFKKDNGSTNICRVDAYKFYLFPVAFDAFAKRELLSCQISCVNFLARHNFDFNKFFREGVPYLNKEKAESLRSFLKTNRHFMHTSEHLDEYYFPKKENILCDEDIEDIINRLAGFSKIIDVINEAGIPVVGHNFLTDLLMTYHLFYSNLPPSYEGFKTTVHEHFPLIYDTKYLAREVHNLRREVNVDDNVLFDSNLFGLYTNIYTTCGTFLPIIMLQGGAEIYKEALIAGRAKNLETIPDTACHSADFDAIITGCVFLNISTMACNPQPEAEYRRRLPATFSELLGKTECWSNRVNVARAVIPHVNLAGPDPEPHRPNWIVVQSLKVRKFIDPVRLKLELVKYGDLEIEAVNDKEVVIACGSMGCHRRVWKDLIKKGFTLREQCVSSNIPFFSKWKHLVPSGLVAGIAVGGAIIMLIKTYLEK